MGQRLTLREVPIRSSIAFSHIAFNVIEIRPHSTWLQLPTVEFFPK